MAELTGSTVDVSVIIPTYNSRELVCEALAALRAQTLAAEQFEVIVVDDGSTDGSWDELERSAQEWPQLQIFSQANSGTPSVGRNAGLRHATGHYVFFHDADDWMPPYALAELVDRADELDADVVVGRSRNVGGGRRVSLLRESTDADLIADRVWTSLSAQKLFRRELVERLGLQFCEDMVQGEDQIFSATALLAARRIATLTDKDYYIRRRDRGDGGNLSRRPQPLANKVLTCTRLTQQIEAAVPAGEQPAYFDRILLRTLAPALDAPFMKADGAEQTTAIKELQRTVLPHLSERQLTKAADDRRLRLLVAAAGEPADLVLLNRWWRTEPQIRTGEDGDVYAVPSALAALLEPADLRVSGSAAPESAVPPPVPHESLVGRLRRRVARLRRH